MIFDFPAYFGLIFEDFVKNDVFGYLYPYYNIGTWWHKDTEIDIVAISQNQGKIVFCECKWKDHVDPGRILPGLKRKAEKFLQEKNYERASYHIIAKSFSDKYQDSDLTLTDLSDMELIFKNSNKSD